MLTIKTLNDASFAQMCRRLEALSATYVPDAVVGIATGGEVVAGLMWRNVPHYSIVAQRPSTAVKNRYKGLQRLMRRLPLWVCDMLRIAEARILNVRQHTPPHISIDPAVAEALTNAQRILVVDDAIDSGATMAGVLKALYALPCAEHRRVRVAVVTVTTKHPLVVPQYCIYDNETLVRFPWSSDAQNRISPHS